MERLQAALEKARAQREGRDTGAAPSARIASPRPGAPSSGRAGAARAPGSVVGEHPDARPGIAPPSPATASSPSAAGPEAGAVDMLRTRVVQMMRQNGWRRVAVTSPDKSAGKSTTCCNLLVSLSRQTDRRTILFDLDLRRPGARQISWGTRAITASSTCSRAACRSRSRPCASAAPPPCR
jgi:protein-tyrosine kinase